MAFVEMDVPADLVRHIIGKGGQHLARLQKVSTNEGIHLGSTVRQYGVLASLTGLWELVCCSGCWSLHSTCSRLAIRRKRLILTENFKTLWLKSGQTPCRHLHHLPRYHVLHTGSWCKCRCRQGAVR